MSDPSTPQTRKLGIGFAAGLILISGILFLASSCTSQTTSEPPKSAKAATETPGKPAAATVYTCPMHPEVVQNGPGKCPKCGMNLIPKT
jgi:hypothetical protein